MKRRKAVRLLAPIFLLALIFGLSSLFVSLTKATSNEDLSLETASRDELVQKISQDTSESTEMVEQRLFFQNAMVLTNDYDYLANQSIIKAYYPLTDNLTIVTFDSTLDTAKAYLQLREHFGDNNVFLDMPLETEQVPDSYVGIYASDEGYNWGALTTGTLEYADDLAKSGHGTEVRVAVIDTGINPDHILFFNENPKDRLDLTRAGNYLNAQDSCTETDEDGFCYIFDENNGYPGPTSDISDNFGHGTAVASAITEATAGNVKIVPMKAGATNEEGNCSTNAVIFALNDVIKNHSADIVNLSVAANLAADDITDATLDYFNALDSQILKSAYDSGITLVAASGNYKANADNYWPANSKYTISVSSVNQEDNFSSEFSNYGSTVDFTAPGEDVILADYETLYDGYYSGLVRISGTSFSSPMIAAAAANILTEYPNYTPDQVYNEIKLNTYDRGEPGKDDQYGWGSLNFYAYALSDITFDDVELSTTEMTDDPITATISAHTDSEFSAYTFTQGDNTKVYQEANAWKTFDDSALTQTISKNGTYTIWLKNTEGRTQSMKFTVSNINSPEEEEPKQDDSDKSSEKDVKSPETGDNSSKYVLIGATSFGLIGAASFIIIKRRH